jgi:glucosamine-phosphate N-acetyltransferase
MIFRRLEKDDFNLGYLQLLEQLTHVGSISIEDWNNRYDEIKNNSCIQIWVILDKDTIIATGTIILEPKFIHNIGRVGHIEDIVVHRDKNGLGIGKKLIDDLVNIARNSGCYKVILNCSDKNIGFYEKVGFTLKERQMAHYF